MITLALSSGSYDSIPADARSGLRDAIKINQRMGWTTEIRWSEEDEHPAVVIDANTTLPDPNSVSTCETTVYGIIETIGGKTPAVVVRTDGGDRVRCPVSAEVARSLANRLYQPVRITGLAEYSIESMAIEMFITAEIEPFEEVSLSASMGELRGALAIGWDETPVGVIMRDLRGVPV
jgi:hypothetical protein